MGGRACLWLLCVWLGTLAPVAAAEVELQLTLPKVAYAVVGEQAQVYFDNIVLTKTPQDYRFVVTCQVGQSQPHDWSLTPTAAEVGDHPWKIEVFEGQTRLASGEMVWKVVSAAVQDTRPVKLLIVGDSLTHASLYPNDLSKRYAAASKSSLIFLGTHKPARVLPGVAHEGYGGWTWARFLQHYDRAAQPGTRGSSSPFVFLVNDQPQLDVARTIRELYHRQSPDYVLFLLGINDCFGANPNDPVALDQHIEKVLKNAEILIAAFRAAAPQAELGIGLTTPGNEREAAFEANYKGKYSRWGWKRIQHQLVRKQLEQFSGREQERVFVVPTELGVDPVGGFPPDNAVHPNEIGYQQIAGQMHAWLQWRLSVRD